MIQDVLDECAMLGFGIIFLLTNLGLEQKLNNKRECLQDRRVQWFGYLKIMENTT